MAKGELENNVVYTYSHMYEYIWTWENNIKICWYIHKKSDKIQETIFLS